LAESKGFEAAFEALERDGFALIPEVLSEQEVARVRSRLVEVARLERTAGIDHDPKWKTGLETSACLDC
jgi:hypothetical protein